MSSVLKSASSISEFCLGNKGNISKNTLSALHDHTDIDNKRNYEMYTIKKYIVFGILMSLPSRENRSGL